MLKSWTRWIPAIVVPMVVVAGAVIIPVAANASPQLPAKTAQELLEFVAGSAKTEYSGTVDQTSNLGLPQIPSIGGSGASGGSTTATVLDLLTAPHTVRVFVGADHEARAQVLDSLAERDVIVNATDAWAWDSKSNIATHLRVPVAGVAMPTTPSPTGELAKTPAEVTKQLLSALDPSTTVSVTNTARVAGRPVYQLVLTPKSGSTLVGSVVIAVDSETGLPLGVDVTAVGQNGPALSIEFSSIDFTAPSPSMFVFTPPAGAKVTEQAAPSGGSTSKVEANGAGAKPSITGTGWSTIVQLPAGTLASTPSSPSKLLDQLLTPVAGGKALQTTILSVLMTDDGRVFVGAVGIEQLQAAAAQ